MARVFLEILEAGHALQIVDAAQMVSQRRREDGEQLGHLLPLLGRAGDKVPALEREVAAGIDQRTPQRPRFPPFRVGAVGAEDQEHADHQAQNGVHGRMHVRVTSEAGIFFDDGQHAVGAHQERIEQ